MQTAWDALRQLGAQRVTELVIYRLGLLSGHYRRVLQPAMNNELSGIRPKQVISPPARDEVTRLVRGGSSELLAEADEIVSGRYRIFGASPVALNLAPTPPLHHWTDYERGKTGWGMEDVKFIWEPARFGWAVTLARAYQLNGNETYARSFWDQTRFFQQFNPAFQGPNWASGQEVALRLICLSFALSVFGTDHPEDVPLAAMLAEHAERIPPTLIYARAQNNNHLLSEAVGLYTAAALLPDHPNASQWRRLGWRWMNICFQQQIAPDGTYLQHSTNYHRLMLQLALWAHSLVRNQGERLPDESLSRLAVATRWLLQRLDFTSGRTPNTGHNDGAHILPLAGGGFHDFRPVAQAASRAFLGSPCLPPGPWDEMSLWLGDYSHTRSDESVSAIDNSAPLILRGKNTWASLRAVNYFTRPGQADQLHVDVFWRGEPVTLDAGTFQYNAAPPWENALAGTVVHNTITIQDQNQMRRAGRFLWLNWAKVQVLRHSQDKNEVAAQHEGYLKRFGVIHLRQLSLVNEQAWQITDQLIPSGKGQDLTFSLHWLLPDWSWDVQGQDLYLESPFGPVRFEINVFNPAIHPSIQLIRAGESLYGSPPNSPIFGWTSPTYGVKIPALSLRYAWKGIPPFEVTTRITLGV